MKNHRRFLPGVINHCYQNTRDGFLLFYSICDYLACFTIICTVARRHHVKVLSLCLMPDHLHGSFVADYIEELCAFVGHYTSSVARENNETCGHAGPLFNEPFGSAPKPGGKNGRTNLIYVGNNPVERHLADKAENYRWNYLAYAESDHPFSAPIVKRKASGPLKIAVAQVDALRRSNRPIPYKMLKRMFSRLGRKEANQLTDYIIATYNVIDYVAAAKYFDNFDAMLTAMHSTTGNEYEIDEQFCGRRDDVYAKMTSLLLSSGKFQDIHDILKLSLAEKMRLFNYLLGKTSATRAQIMKFLRIKQRP
ncbi:MAG: hypothetical protein II465_02620 [Bacteroidales bacterium]|nr:hypothetical protein [Bacteroidales bacterium]